MRRKISCTLCAQEASSKPREGAEAGGGDGRRRRRLFPFCNNSSEQFAKKYSLSLSLGERENAQEALKSRSPKSVLLFPPQSHFFFNFNFNFSTFASVSKSPLPNSSLAPSIP